MKGLDIQSLSHVCASFYILIMVLLSFDNFKTSLYPSFKHNAWTVTAVIGPMFALVVLNICAFLVECFINQIYYFIRLLFLA